VESFVALVIYPTTADAQSRQADNLVRLVGAEVRRMPGFQRGQVLVSEDGASLVTLTEWSDRESFDRFRASDFGRAAVHLTAGLGPKTFWLRPHAAIAPE